MLLPERSIGPSAAVFPLALADAQAGAPQLGFQFGFQAGRLVAFFRWCFHILFSHIVHGGSEPFTPWRPELLRPCVGARACAA